MSYPTIHVYAEPSVHPHILNKTHCSRSLHYHSTWSD